PDHGPDLARPFLALAAPSAYAWLLPTVRFSGDHRHGLAELSGLGAAAGAPLEPGLQRIDAALAVPGAARPVSAGAPWRAAGARGPAGQLRLREHRAAGGGRAVSLRPPPDVCLAAPAALGLLPEGAGAVLQPAGGARQPGAGEGGAGRGVGEPAYLRSRLPGLYPSYLDVHPLPGLSFQSSQRPGA